MPDGVRTHHGNFYCFLPGGDRVHHGLYHRIVAKAMAYIYSIEIIVEKSKNLANFPGCSHF